MIFNLKERIITTGSSTECVTDSDEDIGGLADKILRTALDIGEHMLRCGGEVNRVEDAIMRVCRAYGARHVEVFSLPTLIIASLRMHDGEYATQIRRVLSSDRNLGRLEQINKISRYICANTPSHEEAQRLIKEAKQTKIYPAFVSYIAAGIVTGSFSVFFGGSVIDAFCAAVIGVIVQFIVAHKGSVINKMLHYVICAFAAGCLSMIAQKLSLADNVDKVIIGSIMILVPGLALDTSLRDLLCGDTVSGLMGFIQSIMLAAMIATGLTLSIIVFGGTI